MADTGVRVPSLENRPDLFVHLNDYWSAFISLDRGRYHGGTGFPQPITLAEIKAYADLHNFKEYELGELCHYVREIDSIYLKIQADKREKESKRKK